MRQGPNNRRSRNRGNGGGPGPGPGPGTGGGGNSGGGNGGGNSGGGRRPSMPMRHQTFDSNGPDVRIRGNAFQVYEKYLTLARDATTSGDRIAAENYLQHAEHYYRIINQHGDAEAQRARHQRMENGPGGPGDGEYEGGGEDGGDDAPGDPRAGAGS